MAKNRVLVVDDEEDIRELLQIHLGALGWNVDTAASPKTALKMLNSNNYFVLLTDLAMPEMDGYELIKEIKSRYPDLPCAVITGFGYDANHSLVKLNKEFQTSIFLKPFDFKENLIGKYISEIWDKNYKTSKTN